MADEKFQFEVTAVPVSLVYGDVATPLLTELARRYEEETGIKARHWVMRLYSNGATIPTPTQITPKILPDVRVQQLFGQAVRKMVSVGMQERNEADRFNLMFANDCLQELSWAA